MDRRRIELQIRAVVVTFRIERRRRDTSDMDAFRARARSILESLTEEARPYPDLASQLEHVLGELDVDREVRQTDPRLAG
jgi:hypothetical protein